MKADISTAALRQAIAVREKIESLESELARILGGGGAKSRPGRRRRPAPVATAKPAKGRRKKRMLSPEARAKIVAAVKARWERVRAGKGK